MSDSADRDDDAAESWSTTAVARRLGVSTPTVQRWVDAGILRAWKTPGGHRRVDAESARALMRVKTGWQGRPVSVVVVDDNPDDRDLLEAIVRAAVPEVGVACYDNAMQALVAIGHHSPRVVITDIVMPHMDGLEMIHQLAEHCAVKPQLLVAVSATELLGSARQRGLPPDVVFMTKPVDAPRLSALLQGVLPAAQEAPPATGPDDRLLGHHRA
ncbi:MAG: response regulator [Rubrivivax sp.]